MSTVLLSVTISRQHLDQIKAMRVMADLPPVSDQDLAAIIWEAGVRAERRILAEMADEAA